LGGGEHVPQGSPAQPQEGRSWFGLLAKGPFLLLGGGRPRRHQKGKATEPRWVRLKAFYQSRKKGENPSSGERKIRKQWGRRRRGSGCRSSGGSFREGLVFDLNRVSLVQGGLGRAPGGSPRPKKKISMRRRAAPLVGRKGEGGKKFD